MKNRVKKQALSFAAAMAMILGGGMQLYAADKIADTVYRNGKIYTITETVQEAKDVKNAKKVDVVATLNGKIIFVGSEADAKAQGFLDENKVSKIVDLRGKTMLPGFVDGHGHFPSQGDNDLFQVNLNSPLLDGTVDTMDKLIAELAKKAETLPAGSPILGWNYDDTQLAEQRHPTRYDLDKASTTHPILIKHISGHMAVANSAALALSNVTSETNVEGVMKDPKTGEPTGFLVETKAMQQVPLSVKSNSAFGVARASQVYTAAGVTTADSGGTGVSGQVPLLQKTLSAGQLDLRVLVHPIAYYPYEISPGTFIDAMGLANRKALGWKDTNRDGKFTDATSALQIGNDLTFLKASDAEVPSGLPANTLMLGAHKIIFDGSPQGYTAWMKRPGYYDWSKYTADDSFDNAGYFNGLEVTLNLSVKELKDTIKLYHAAGQSVEVHTNGPAAAEAYVSAIEEAVADHPEVKDTRHTSIHGQTMERQHIERLSGHYENLEATADMYEDLEGAFKGGKVDLSMGGKLPNNLDKLMAAQNTVNSYFNNHTYFYGYRHTNQFFGPGRASNMSPAGWSEAYGQRYTFHNDTFVTPISPLRSIQSGVTRFSGDARAVAGQENITVTGTGHDLNATVNYEAIKGDPTTTRKFWTYDQRINPLQAIHAVTIGPAYQNKVEDRIGSIAEGKLADFVILDEDIMDVAAKEPLRIANMRVASTIVSDKIVHGVLPDSKTFISQFRAAYEQPTLDTVVTIQNSQMIDNATADKEYAALERGEKRFGTLQFTAEVAADSSAIFQMNMLGNGEKISALKLYKLTANKKSEYTYGRPAPDALGSASGQWWIASFGNPTIPLDQDAVLEMDKQYVVFFIIHDNDSIFDADKADGVIVDPVTMVSTSGTLPTNGGTADTTHSDDDGGSSSGCTVGSTPSYDLLVLFLGMSAVAAIRVLRRRNEQ